MINESSTNQEIEIFILESSEELIESYLPKDKTKRFNKIKQMSTKARKRIEDIADRKIKESLEAIKNIIKDGKYENL